MERVNQIVPEEFNQPETDLPTELLTITSKLIHHVFLLARRLSRVLSDFSLWGLVVCKWPGLRTYKEHLLGTWQNPKQRTSLDNFLFFPTFQFWCRFEYLREKDPIRREAMKGLAMGGKSGAEWARYYDSLPLDFSMKEGSLTLREACPVFEELEKTCAAHPGKLVVIQVGCSSGREISWLAEMFPQHTYVGTDIYENVVRQAAEHHKRPSVSFELCKAEEMFPLLQRFARGEGGRKPQDIVVFSQSSLQYVQPEHLGVFFQAVNSCPSIKVLVNEPANDSLGNPLLLSKSQWRGSFSWTHNYRKIAEREGILTLRCELVKPYVPPDAFPSNRGTVLYFYSGKKGPRF